MSCSTDMYPSSSDECCCKPIVVNVVCGPTGTSCVPSCPPPSLKNNACTKYTVELVHFDLTNATTADARAVPHTSILLLNPLFLSTVTNFSNTGGGNVAISINTSHLWLQVKSVSGVITHGSDGVFASVLLASANAGTGQFILTGPLGVGKSGMAHLSLRFNNF